MLEQGDIVLVPFPFTDLSAAKVRPALVLSVKNGTRPDVIVCFISSNLATKNPYAVAIEPRSTNGLKVPSLVRFDKVATLDRRIVLGAIGRVSPAWLKEHRGAFLSVFGL